MDDFFEFILNKIGVVLFLLLTLLGALATMNLAGKYQCNNYEKITGIETRWATLDICYVKTTNGYERWDEYKARAVTRKR